MLFPFQRKYILFIQEVLIHSSDLSIGDRCATLFYHVLPHLTKSIRKRTSLSPADASSCMVGPGWFSIAAQYLGEAIAFGWHHCWCHYYEIGILTSNEHNSLITHHILNPFCTIVFFAKRSTKLDPYLVYFETILYNYQFMLNM